MTRARALIRADGSQSMGLGHVMRSLALAEALAIRGWRVSFALQGRPGHPAETVRARGFETLLLPEGAPETDWTALGPRLESGEIGLLVIDHPEIDEAWQRRASERVPRLVILDDRADRNFWGHVLINVSPGVKEEDYRPLVPEFCRLLLGPRYALIRPEFLAHRPVEVSHRPLRNVLVSFGGADGKNQTEKTLRALSRAAGVRELDVHVVLGGANRHAENVPALLPELPFRVTVHRDVRDMASLTARMDLAVGAAGGSAWERCCLGVPSVMVICDGTEAAAAEYLAKAGAGVNLGWHSAVRPEAITQTVQSLLSDPVRLAEMRKGAWGFVDGQGPGRIVQEIEAYRAHEVRETALGENFPVSPRG
ncbi:MAG: UDP-2,4-diacetamido-2,4,6-trideoxy-beta-L-altropyranose hydrolase [Nitrospinota bacterium]